MIYLKLMKRKYTIYFKRKFARLLKDSLGGNSRIVDC